MTKVTPKPGRGASAADSDAECGSPTATCEATEKRCCMIAEAAYFRALERNFAPGMEIDDWLEAEREIDSVFPPPPGN